MQLALGMCEWSERLFLHRFIESNHNTQNFSIFHDCQQFHDFFYEISVIFGPRFVITLIISRMTKINDGKVIYLTTEDGLRKCQVTTQRICKRLKGTARPGLCYGPKQDTTDDLQQGSGLELWWELWIFDQVGKERYFCRTRWRTSQWREGGDRIHRGRKYAGHEF